VEKQVVHQHHLRFHSVEPWRLVHASEADFDEVESSKLHSVSLHRTSAAMTLSAKPECMSS
jgi:hypothetical protein